MTVVGRVMTAAAVVAGSIVLGGSAQAAVARQAEASGEITSPSDGQVITGSSVTVSAHTGLMQLKMGLYVDGPSTPSQKIASGGANQTISGTFDAGSAPNGTFTVTLKGEITGAKYATSTFKLRRPPETPGNVNARLEGDGKVEVTWSKGAEPDLQSYEVSTSQSGIVGRLPADNACSGSSCKATLAVPAKAAGQRVGITVKAYRGDGDGGSIGSGKSGAAYVTVPAPATSQPKKQTTNTRQAPKTDGKKAVEPLPTLPGKKQTKPMNVPTRKPTTHDNTSALPAMPDTDAKGDLPIPTAADDEGETGGLAPSGTDESAKNDTGSAPVEAGGVKARSDESPMGSIGQYGVYVACGLLLLLLAAHFGAWARRRALASAGGRTAASVGATVAASGGGGTSAPQATDGVPPTATASRRPAVVLAVAKTRMPEPRQEHLSTSISDKDSGTLAAADRTPSSAMEADRVHGTAAAMPERAPGMLTPAADEAVGQSVPASDPVSGTPAPASGQAHGGSLPASLPISGTSASAAGKALGDPAPASGLAPDRQASAADSARVPGQGRGHVPTALPMYLGVQDLRAAEAARQEPLRIALPSSAVTDVPEAPTSAIPAAVPLEDRWDDYLPPSPRSMEDSGFWERPQPGAGDFWAADDEERAYVGRRYKEDDSWR